ncbi:hypothetical protein C8R45DRAFT_1107074 [Mycena sanguinolenta]|nr:hypothetical protein C8R45DRAFT_1107074 [Mycena sanguinolenta]
MDDTNGAEQNQFYAQGNAGWMGAQTLPQDQGHPSTNTNYYSQMAGERNHYENIYGPNAGGGPVYDSPGNASQAQPHGRMATGENGQNWDNIAQQVAQQVQGQFEANIQALQTRIIELEQIQKKAAEADDSTSPIDRRVYRLINQTMTGLLGMDDPKSKVPGPLAPGEAPRIGPNNVILHNPTWKGKADGTQPLVIATVHLVLANEKASRTLPAELGPLDGVLKSHIKTAAIQHWRTKQGKYLAQTTEEGRNRQAKKSTYNSGYGRGKRLAASRRKAIPAFKEQFGEEKSRGVDAMVHTPWCSEDESEPGEADPALWRARRKETGDKYARERIRIDWRGEKLDRIVGALDTIAREQAAEASPSFVQGGKERKRGRSKGRRGKARIPFKSCFNPKWLEANPSYEPLDDPEDFTVFSLTIADEDLDEEALALLVDDVSEQ